MTEIRTTAEAQEEAALPRAKVVHTASDAPQTAEVKPLPPELTREPPEDKSPAQWAYERVLLYIQNFEEQLKEDEEVVLGLTGGEAGVLQIEGIGFFDPDILTFYGTDEYGARTQLIQHVNQLNVMLIAQPKLPEDEAPRRIGFRLARALEEDSKAQKTPPKQEA
ncbi:DUF6173 family protein [Thioclava pacifica]|uniref:Uncharacterized protein n=1 Tax=Thioclava pacifica DSM 10166 TaxID=1353537 RepID=A0A074J585_9RHOB|nr:DUF6173 family protein [Thioclava pacifica]KEO52601.1 hypothetical protein TP2_06595 [Thioclava pacifica DSM 10166]